MGKVFFSVAMTIDGFIAPAGEAWMEQWMELQE
jgi:hypothetical protein